MSVPVDSSPENSPPAATTADTRSSVLTIVGLLAIAGVVLALFLVRRIGDKGAEMAKMHAAVGAPIENFELPLLTGSGEKVTAESLRGKVKLVSFWGTWCVYCMREFPDLVRIAGSHKARDDFIWLPVTYPNVPVANVDEVRGDVEKYLKNSGMSVTTYHDPYETLAIRARVAQAYDGKIPLTMILDRENKIYAVWNGYAPGVEAQIETVLEELLNAK